MKRTALGILILMLLLSVTAHARGRGPRNAARQKNVAAEREWTPFFKRLKVAVKRRDRAQLKELMLPEFHYTLGHHGPTQQNDRREDAFKYWDDPHNPGWKALERTLAQGTVPMAAWWRAGNRENPRPTRVAPPAANIKRRVDRNMVPYIAIFEYRDGRWYFTLFDICCD